MTSEDIKHQLIIIITNAWAWFNSALRPRKPQGSLGRTAQDGHLDSHTAPEICTHTKSSLARIDKRTARAAGNTRYRYNKIGPLDHKMADNCVSLARTNTLSSTITKPIKTWKTSNTESYSYNLLNRVNKMYTHDLFTTRVGSVAIAPVYKQIETTKSQLTQCTKY